MGKCSAFSVVPQQIDQQSRLEWINHVVVQEGREQLKHLMEMDEEKEKTSEINSFHVKIMPPPTNIVYLGKKRNLEDEQLDLPSPKHKFREQRSSGSKQESPFPDDLEVKPLNSAKDSNSFVGESNSAISFYPGDKFEPEFRKAYAYDQPSTSSCSCSGDSSKDTLNSKTKISAMDDIKTEDLNLTSKNPEPQLSGLGKYADSICLGRRDDEMEECPYVVSKDLMTNPNFHVLSSRRRCSKKRTRIGSRKLNIDQEFEKYFSKLML